MKVALVIPCYVNAIYPEVGVASYKLLKQAGLDVTYPKGQTCCGQPMGNGGYEGDSAELAAYMSKLFAYFDYVVGPSGSCVGYVKETYPRLLHQDKKTCLSSRIYEICEFLHDVVKVQNLPARFPHKVSLHNSCHGVRILHLSSMSEENTPHFSKLKDLLHLVEGIEVVEPKRVDECCGFGGLFSMEEPWVSGRMGRDKVSDHMSTGAEVITGADCSCLMHMQGIIKRNGYPIQTKHIVEILTANER